MGEAARTNRPAVRAASPLRPRVGLAWLVMASLALATLLGAAAQTPLVERARGLVQALETRWPEPPADSVARATDAMLREAAAASDAHARAWLLAARAEQAVTVNDDRAMRAAADEALALPEATRDSELHARLLSYLAWAAYHAGDDSAARRVTARWTEVIERGTSDGLTAEWLYYRAHRELATGVRDSAEAHMLRARSLFESSGDRARDLQSRTMLGLLSGMGGRLADARRWLTEARDGARREGRLPILANALANLGTLERVEGRREGAARVYAEAADVARRLASRKSVADALRGQMVAAEDLGRAEELATLADSLTAIGVQLGRADLRGVGLAWRARAAIHSGRPELAADVARRALAMGDSLPVGTRSDLVGVAQEALFGLRRDEEMLALSEAHRDAAMGSDVHRRAQFESYRAYALRRLGRRAEAEAAARRSLAELAGTGLRLDPYQIGAWLVLAHIRLDEGRLGEALAEYERAEAGLFQLRAGMGAAIARQSLVTNSRDYSGFLVRAAMRSDRARAEQLFARLEALKARSLFEQLRSDSSRADLAALSPAVTPTELRRDVLREGEAFLAPHLSSDTAGVFVVTRDTFAIVPLRDPDGSAARRLHDLGRALARRPSDSRGGDATLDAARATLASLFADARPLLAGTRRWLWSPEGVLHRVPGSLVAEALAAGAPPEVAQVPSAAVLRALRGRAATPSLEPRVLALTTSVRVDSALAGPAVEVRWLRDAFERVERVDGATFADAREATRGWSEHDVLHFSGHTRIENDRPWNSSMVLGTTPDGGAPLGVSAEDVLGLKLSTRLAVLAACQSVGDRVVGSEGAAGLAAAFLAAGVPTVVATHWRVDDRATAVLMRAFYAALARGGTASQALREAQGVVRAKPEWRHPYWWSGFAVLGDPDRTVPLRPVSPWRRVPWIPLAASAAVFAVGLALRPRRRDPS